MLIRINKTTWISAADIQKIEVNDYRSKSKETVRYLVDVSTADQNYTSFFDTEDAAVAAATKIAVDVNEAEMMT